MEVESSPSVLQTQHNLFSFVRDQLSADPMQSKKFIMALVGINAVLLSFIIDAILFFYRPGLAPYLVSITTILMPTVAGMVGIYLGAQGQVEVKANGVLQSQAQDLSKKLQQ